LDINLGLLTSTEKRKNLLSVKDWIMTIWTKRLIYHCLADTPIFCRRTSKST
jgi:hypothetical protein